tara:strand:+ start:592 stop:1002 length:411 start_codon:yes stop_codon:yes gene_type:complete
LSKHEVRIKIGEKWYTVEVDNLEYSPITVKVDGESFEFEMPDLPLKSNQQPIEPESSVDMPENASNDSVINSPIAGKILAIKIKPGSSVKTGDELCIIEAMKMEQSIRAHGEAKVKKIFVKPMDQVNTNDPLIEFE